ncbi:beta-lactamase/transpeptidase-like protein [Rhodotorula sp. JG-1b]|nr:beta-lactamase/transpeptidase-like protein [Rhodotorula sp. JG-1b]
MLHNAQELDTTIARLTQDPYRDLPRLVVMAATSDEPLIYAGRGGYDQLPSQPVDRSELERTGQPVTEDSIFELYSCTKLPAVIAGLQLLEQGKIALDDDASRYVPELKTVKVFRGFDDKEEPILEPLSRPVTIHMLLTHTSGSLYTLWDPNLNCVAAKLAGQGNANLSEIPFAAQPGEKFCYGYSLDYLTLVVEKVSGLTLEEYFKQNIFAPLGIEDMSFLAKEKQMPMAFETPSTPDAPYEIRPNDPMSETQHFGGAGLSGSPRSYLKLIRTLLKGGELDGARILRKETVDLMFKEQFDTDEQRQAFHQMAQLNFDPAIRKSGKVDPATTHGYGGGLHAQSETGKSAGTLSWSGMANTYWWVDRDNDVAAVVFTNVLPVGTRRVMEAWHEVEKQLYDGLKK